MFRFGYKLGRKILRRWRRLKEWGESRKIRFHTETFCFTVPLPLPLSGLKSLQSRQNNILDSTPFVCLVHGTHPKCRHDSRQCGYDVPFSARPQNGRGASLIKTYGRRTRERPRYQFGTTRYRMCVCVCRRLRPYVRPLYRNSPCWTRATSLSH